MSKWAKKLNVVKFKERIPCPYCPETFPSNLSLSRHVLREHNWNKDFLKGFEVIETYGSVMVVKKVEEVNSMEEEEEAEEEEEEWEEKD